MPAPHFSLLRATPTRSPACDGSNFHVHLRSQLCFVLSNHGCYFGVALDQWSIGAPSKRYRGTKNLVRLGIDAHLSSNSPSSSSKFLFLSLKRLF